ncbi:MAG: ABC transporter permease subunit [Micromonosporaceae bacterium]|nr:ABC transporter permease subunit [Micromonosporaceae bacterium]
MSVVLYDIPGPRARLRNRAIGVAAALAIVALIWYVIDRFYDTGQFEYIKWAQFEFRSVQLELLNGLLATLKAFGLGAVLALLFGAIFATGRLSDHLYFRAPSNIVVELFRAIPLLILMFLFYYGSRQLGYGIPALWAVVLGLTLYNGSVLAEIFRAGILAVARGQSEAAYAIGLRKTQVMTLVLLPQAVRSMLPSIVSQMVVLLKDTALGFIITYPELLYVGRQIGNRLAFGVPQVPVLLVVATVYIAMCALLSWFAHWLERRMREGARKKGIPVVEIATDEVTGVVQAGPTGIAAAK